MAKLNKTCAVCGKQYKYCYSCPSDLNNPSWKNLFDTENCREIFNILCKESQNKVTIVEAKELLNKCDLSQKDTFSESIKNHINKVFNVNENSEEIESKEIIKENKVVENIEVENQKEQEKIKFKSVKTKDSLKKTSGENK